MACSREMTERTAAAAAGLLKQRHVTTATQRRDWTGLDWGSRGGGGRDAKGRRESKARVQARNKSEGGRGRRQVETGQARHRQGLGLDEGGGAGDMGEVLVLVRRASETATQKQTCEALDSTGLRD